jgi:hypothetical protein
MQCLDSLLDTVALFEQTAGEWRPGAGTCRSLRLVMNSILSSVFVGWYINCRKMRGIVIRKQKLYELARSCKNVDTLNKYSKESRGFVEGDSDVLHKFLIIALL